jgi:hypothetical protein
MNNNSSPVRRISFLSHIKATYQEIYWPFGEMLLLKTNHPELLDVAEEAFGRFPKNKEPGVNSLTITLLVLEGDKQSRVLDRIKPRFNTIAHHFFICIDKDNFVVADVNHGHADGYLTPEVVNDRAYVRYYVLEALSQAMLGRARNFLSIHAACIQKNGVSLILQGKAGSGKSTLAFACLRNNYQLLAEDVVHVKFCNGDLYLRGSPWKFHLLPDAIQFFPEINLEKPRLQMNNEWKLEIEIEDYYPGAAITEAQPGPILLVTRNPTIPAAIELLPPEIAIKEFEIVWPWQEGWSEEHETAAKQLLRNGVFRLYTGSKIFESINLIDELVEKVAK